MVQGVEDSRSPKAVSYWSEDQPAHRRGSQLRREIKKADLQAMGDFNEVPEGCIATIFAFTTPADVCRLALVSTAFGSASESDVIWERFLPSDRDLIVARSEDGEALLDEFPTKKQLYMRLACRPLLIDGATKSFWLDKSSGSKCLMLSARSISIIWSDTPTYWRWTSIPESRFPEVAQLRIVCWLEIRGKIQTSDLSPETRYSAFLVYKITENEFGLDTICETSVSTSGVETETQRVRLIPNDELSGASSEVSRVDEFPKPRPDGWQELKIGEFFTHLGEEDLVELSLLEIKTGRDKSGLIIEGIEVRPAHT